MDKDNSMDSMDKLSIQHEILRRTIETTTNGLRNLDNCNKVQLDEAMKSLHQACVKAISKLDEGLDKITFE